MEVSDKFFNRREKIMERFLIVVYEIVEVESDQYMLKVIEKNNSPATEGVKSKLSCLQLKKYAFEVEQKQ